MAAVNIRSFSQVIPMIYAYSTPGVPYHEGWVKIGYTEKKNVESRIAEQTHTAGIRWALEWQDNAMYKDGSGGYFTDHDFHDWLEAEKKVEREKGTEWFRIGGDESYLAFVDFTRRQTRRVSGGNSYLLRNEQSEAVAMTKAYFERGGTEFLWNAKPRFGKTLTSYDLVRKMGFTKVLIVTNRPSIANSWAEDFNKFIGWRSELCFVSDTDALKGKAGVLTREAYLDQMIPLEHEKGMVAFESLQGLKGSVYFGGEYNKLKWIRDMEFDLLIVDEAQEGVDTVRTERAFDQIKRRHTLYLSGTPFKQLASDRFGAEQIYNWSYADEQQAKAEWKSAEQNPYGTLPKLSMFTYQLSNMITDEVKRGLDLSGEDGTVDYAFDLNEFFITNDQERFVHEAEIKRFLQAMVTQEKYPFSTPELRKQLPHTLWILDRVASCRALAKLLQQDEVFREYEIVLAAGDGKLDPEAEETQAAFDRVKQAIREHDRTITLSVGQLTVGVTVPEWSGVMMLCNCKSPSSYMQAAFRAQNPCMLRTGDGQYFRKETAYVFDFDPARTLIIFDEFANNLSPDTASGRGTGDDRKENIRRLLNFFPVLGEDTEGSMIELDAAQVLSIPRRLKSAEVVRHGFMSNFLFRNISNVFGAPAVVKEIVEKLTPAHEEKGNRGEDPIKHADEVSVDENGEATVSAERVIGTAAELFGDKVYEKMGEDIHSQTEVLKGGSTPKEVKSKLDDITKAMKDSVNARVVEPLADRYGLKPAVRRRVTKRVETEIDRKFEKLRGDYDQKVSIAKAELEERRETVTSAEEERRVSEAYQKSIAEATQALTDAMNEAVNETIANKPQELVEMLEKEKANAEMKSVEDSVRAHLRGFSRTIPSFIMAYGDGKLTLANFDRYTEPEVFEQVTGITLEDFRFLRDGGDFTDAETGETQHFAGQLFDEIVFDDSVAEFWNKKQELANYFDDKAEEDIFDYIPPQKTNQIFTPKQVVIQMVDALEENNPGCFDDPNKTFADLYMKSGLYITEIVKRLFRSEGLKKAFPDEKARVRHILEKQVYGMAPTRIIYLIATNYILGFDPELREANHNFVECDAAEASKNGTLAEQVEKYFG